MISDSPKSKPKIMLVQWGRRGAGCKLLVVLARQLKRVGFDVYVSVSDVSENKSQLLDEYPNQLCEISIGMKLNLLLPWKYLKAKKNFKRFLETNKLTTTLFVMPHPWDLGIKPKGKAIRIIHDAIRHPGDGIWPTTNALRRRILTGDSLIALSDSVKNQISKLGAHAQVATHPTFEFQPTDSPLPSSDVLVVGRQRKYKGTKVLIEVWPKVLEKIPSAQLIIAGEGDIDNRISGLENTRVINHWLSESEIGGLLKSTKCVVFPYIEASQSGLLPAARALGLQVVVTPVGGLIDQVSSFGGKVTQDLSATSIARAIVEALLHPQPPEDSRFFNEGNLDLAKLIATISTLEGEKN